MELRAVVVWWFGLVVGLWLSATRSPAVDGGAGPLARLSGADFQGGAMARFGSNHYDRKWVNSVYAQSTGKESSMSAALQVVKVPEGPMFLFLEAMDDDAPKKCRIRLALNGTVPPIAVLLRRGFGLC
jgi:hypothetical protein